MVDFKPLVEQLGDAVLCATLEGEIVFANRAAEKTLGASVGGLIGRRLESIVPERYRVAHREGMRRFRLTRVPVLIGRVVKVEALRSDGTEVPVELTLSTPFGPGSNTVVAVIRDLTERIRLDEDVSRVRDAQGAMAFGRASEMREARLTEVLESARQRAQSRLYALADIARLFLAEIPLDSALHHAARLAVETLGDWAILELARTRAGEAPLIVEHGAGQMAAAIQALGGVAAICPPDSAEPKLLDRLPPGLEGQSAGFGSALLVPLAARGRIRGTMLVGAGPSSPALGAEDIAFAQQLADRVGAELARREAEDRERLLSDVSRILLDYTGSDEVEPLRRILDRIVAGLGDWCAVSLIDEKGLLQQVAAYHPDPRQRELVEKLREYSLPQHWEKAPAGEALRKGAVQIYENIPVERLQASASSPEHLQLILALGLTSAVVAPLRAGDEPLGTLTLASTGRSGRIYTASDIDFVKALGDRASLAVRNARLTHALAEDRDRLREARDEEQRRSAELLAVLESSPNGIILYGPDDRLRYSNLRARQFYGAALERAQGTHAVELFDQWVAPRLAEPATAKDRTRELVADRDSSSVDELKLELPHRIYLRRLTEPVNMPDGTYLGRLEVLIDVTHERELDRQRAEFLTVASHELKTPLTPLSMQLQMMERRAQRGEPMDLELIAKARRQLTRLTALINDLLDFSRLEGGRLALQKELLPLDQVASNVLGDFRGTSARHTFVFEAGDPVMVEGDRLRLEQVFINLVENAIKYSPQGGQVKVRVEKRDAQAVVSISDEGIGVPQEERKRLFERFFRGSNATARNFGGLGIGLHVSNEIVRRHGGRFEVESDEGRGSTFRFFLSMPAPASVGTPGKQRILLVDDDREIVEATGALLEEEGYVVDRALNGEDALAKLRQSEPDLILLDLMMPVLDGWGLVRKLREEHLAQGVPLVVISADRHVRNKANDLHAVAALGKPFDLEELLSVVRRFMPQA